MHSKIKVLSLILIAAVLLPACALRKKKKMEQALETLSTDLVALEKSVNENAFDFEYLSFRGAGRFEGLGMQQNLTLHFRMKRDELVWISVQAILGIEVARALITKDSVFITQNLPEPAYHEYSLDSLSKLLSVPLSVTQLQDLFIGNPLLPYTNALVALQGDSVVVQKRTSDFILREFFANGIPKIARNFLQSTTQAGSADVRYLEFEEVNTKQMPSKVNIFVQRPDFTAKLDLNYSNISLEPISQFPFRKPN